MGTTLDIEVRAALEKRRGDWQAVATGSGVSYSWLSKFANGHIPNPGFATLKQLHEYLAPELIDSSPEQPTATTAEEARDAA